MNTAVNSIVDGTQASEYRDIEILEKIFQTTNKRFFKNHVEANLIWEVPKGTVSVFTGIKGISLVPGSTSYNSFEQAQALIRQKSFAEAVPFLLQCANDDHPESKLLLSHIFKKQNDDRWQQYAASYNKHFSTVRAVPAACYYPETKTIAIHSHLKESHTPQFVLKYLIYHESCHQIIHCSDEAPHPEEFMALENVAPNRERALDWLEKKGFPTLRTADA